MTKYREHPNTDAGLFQEALDSAQEGNYIRAETYLGCIKEKQTYRQNNVDFFDNVATEAAQQHFADAMKSAATGQGGYARTSLRQIKTTSGVMGLSEFENIVAYLEGIEWLNRAVRAQQDGREISESMQRAKACFGRARPEGSNRFITQPKTNTAKKFDDILTGVTNLLSGKSPDLKVIRRLSKQAKKRFTFPKPQADK